MILAIAKISSGLSVYSKNLDFFNAAVGVNININSVLKTKNITFRFFSPDITGISNSTKTYQKSRPV